MNLAGLKLTASAAEREYMEAKRQLERTIRDEVDAARLKIESAHDDEAREVSKLYYKHKEAERALAEAEAEAGRRSYIKLRSGLTLHPGDRIKIERRVRGRSKMVRAYVEVCGPNTPFSQRAADYKKPRSGDLFARIRKKDGTTGVAYCKINEFEDWRID